MTAHNHDLDPACAETIAPDGTVRGACRPNAPRTVRQNQDPAHERAQIADVERLTAVMTRIARHREWFVDEALTAAEYADVDKATKFMHAASEFDHMYESLRARRARL